MKDTAIASLSQLAAFYDDLSANLAQLALGCLVHTWYIEWKKRVYTSWIDPSPNIVSIFEPKLMKKAHSVLLFRQD